MSRDAKSKVPDDGIDRTPQFMRRLLLTREQVAEVLGVDAGCIDYLHRIRRLPGCRVGKGLRWKPATVREYVKTLEPEAS